MTEHIVDVAFRTHAGKILLPDHPMVTHADVLLDSVERGDLPSEALDNPDSFGVPGFLTSLQRFVDRREAFHLARSCQQILEDQRDHEGVLFSEEIDHAVRSA